MLTAGSIWLPSAIAQTASNSPTPGTVITNQATGSFVDPRDSSLELIESNVVQVAVSEVAGIAVTSLGFNEPTDGTVNEGDTVYFDFVITNVGNDPTQFFIPDAANISGGTAIGDIQVVEYDPDGTGTSAVDLSNDSITVPSGGAATGDLTGIPNNGSIPAGATITVRVSVAAGTAGTDLTVTLGDTAAVNGQNEAYVADTNDVYTQDNLDADEAASGAPINGEREASDSVTVAISAVGVTPGISGTLFEDVNRDDLLTNGEPGLPAGAVVRLLDGNNPNIEIATATVNANGQYNFPNVVSGDYIVQVDTATIPEGYLLGRTNNSLITVLGTSIVVDFPFDIVNIAGTVFEDFDGSNTQDGSEFGLQSVTVSLFQDINNDGRLDSNDDTNADGRLDSSDSIAITVTDSDGNYGFNVSDGNYLVLVDSADSSLGNRPYGGTTASPNGPINNPRSADVSGVSVATGLDFPYDVGAPPSICNGEAYTPLFFENPTLEEGSALSLNAVYRFSEVTSGIDALVKVISFNNGAVLTGIDGIGGEVSALQPTLDPAPTTDSSVDFEITFVAAGTNVQTAISKFSAAGLDIDGDGDSAGGGAAGSLREYIELTNFSAYRTETPTTLTASYTPPTGRFESTTTQFQPGISLGAKQAIAVGDFENVSQFRYRVGAIDSGNSNVDRLNSLFFGCVEFDNANVATTAYAVSGTLYRDDDGSDSFDTGESTLPAGISVSLLDGSNVVGTTITDSSGQYVFTSVTNGTYSVQVDTNDTDIPTGLLLGTPNDVSVTVADTDAAPVDFGFDAIPIANDPNLLLVKRITAINRGLAGEELFDNSYINVGTSDDNDNNVSWPGGTATALNGGTVESYIRGITGINDITPIDGVRVSPGDEIEYTISFLSAGSAAAGDVLVCDRIPLNTSFVSDAFNNLTPASAGDGDRGIYVEINSQQVALTNVNDGDEIASTPGNNNGVGGYYFAPGILPSSVFPNIDCASDSNNDTGAIVIDLSDIPNATGEGVPGNSYGFIRFRAAVN